MKKLVKVEEVAGEGLMGLLGERVTLYCPRYFYVGDLIGVNDECVMLENAAIIYDVGDHKSKKYATAEALPGVWYVMKGAVESFGVFKVEF